MNMVAILDGERIPHGAKQDGTQVDCSCRRCRHKWMEFDGTRHTNGSGHLSMCPRCLAGKIDRTRYYKVPNSN